MNKPSDNAKKSTARGLKAAAVGGLLLFLGIVATRKFGGLSVGVEQTLGYVGLSAGGVYLILWGVTTAVKGVFEVIHEKEVQAREPGRLPLVHTRYRCLLALVVQGTLALLLIPRIGAVGLIGGGALALWALVNAVRVSKTLRYPAGELRCTQDGIVLPVGLCSGSSVATTAEGIRHMYYLRRSVPWNRVGPLLVVELADKTLYFPRDWFFSAADQMRAADLVASVRESAKKVEESPKTAEKR